MNKTSLRSFGTYLLYIITVVLLIALLSAWGFYHFEKGNNDNVHNFGDSLWWTIVTMTTIGYGDVYPVTLGGRIVAVLLMFIGIGTLGVSTAAIAAYFVKNDQLEQLRIRGIRNHVIICGLGTKGLLLAKSFRERGDSVIVIENDEVNPFIEAAREQGVVLIGDATEPEMLTKAHVQTARYLIAVCGDDGTNAEVATHARSLLQNRKGISLTCSAHIVDPELWYLLRHWEIATVGAFRMQFFNVFDLGARAMLGEHPPFAGEHKIHHLLIVGSGKLARNIVCHLGRHWRDRSAEGERFKLTLVDKDIQSLSDNRTLAFPGLDKVCDLELLALDPASPEFHHAGFLLDAHKKMTVTAVYVCLENDGLGLSAALALLHRIRHAHVPIVVQMTQNAGLATLLDSTQESTRGFNRIHAVGLLERICQPDLVLGGSNETLAQAMHERYVAEQKRAGAPPSPALVHWKNLAEEFKESNRRQADQIGLRLQSIGCDIAPLSDNDVGIIEFTPEEITKMAKMEHERWVAERQAQGWKFGPRDSERKTNPNMLPWNELPNTGKAMNEQAVRELPASLNHAGFQIYRVR